MNNELADLIGGAQDGRLMAIPETVPVLRIPIVPELVLADAHAGPHSAIEIAEYQHIGRNDAGHLRYQRKR